MNLKFQRLIWSLRPAVTRILHRRIAPTCVSQRSYSLTMKQRFCLWALLSWPPSTWRHLSAALGIKPCRFSGINSKQPAVRIGWSSLLQTSTCQASTGSKWALRWNKFRSSGHAESPERVRTAKSKLSKSLSLLSRSLPKEISMIPRSIWKRWACDKSTRSPCSCLPSKRSCGSTFSEHKLLR